MARIINFSMEVTDDEFANFLARASGSDGRKVTAQVDESDDDAPASPDAPKTDKNGVEWNERFHASSKALNADGTWRARKGMSDEDKAAADEYNKGGASEPTVEPTEEAPVPAMPSLPTPVADAPAMPGLPTPAAAPQPVTYEEVVALYQQAAAKKPDMDVPGIYAGAGVTDPNALKTDAGAEQRIKLAEAFRAIIG